MIVLKPLKITISNFISFAPEKQEYSFPERGIRLILGVKDSDNDSNGSGKSSFIEAMLWCLKGKTIKELTADEVINRNHPEVPAMVCFEFKLRGKVHKVVRVRKKGETSLSYTVDQKDASLKTIKMTQGLIDESLDLSFNAMTRAIICSADQDIPYLKLPESARKEVAENLIFGPEFKALAEKAKKVRKKCKDELAPLEEECIRLETEAKTKIATLKSYRDDREKERDALKKAISELEEVDVQTDLLTLDLWEAQDSLQEYKDTEGKRIHDLESEILELTEHSVDDLKKKADLKGELDKLQREYDIAKKDHGSNVESLKDKEKGRSEKEESVKTKRKELEDIKENKCFTCGAPLDAEKTRELRYSTQASIDLLESEISSCDETVAAAVKIKEDNEKVMGCVREKLDGIQKEYDELEVPLKSMDYILKISSEVAEKKSVLQGKYSDFEAGKKERESNIIRLMGELGVTQDDSIDKPGKTREELEKAESELIIKKDKFSKLQGDDDFIMKQTGEINGLMESFKGKKCSRNSKREDLKYYEFIVKSFGNDETCFKNYYFENVIPFLNKKVTSIARDFFGEDTISIEFDRQLKETITRDGEIASYKSFSLGEKARIDLAILLTFNFFARMKLKESFELISLDEILDGNVDSTGMNRFIEKIEEMAEDMLVFVISHKDKLVHRIRDVLKIEKTGGDSYIT